MTPVEWLVLALVAMGLGLLVLGWTSRVTIVNTTHLELRVGEQKTIEATLFRKPAFRRSIERTQGTVRINARSSLVTVSPSEAATTHQAAASFAVTGATEGEGKAFIMNGKSRHGEHDAVEVTVKVRPME